jgi:hypothetical protein
MPSNRIIALGDLHLIGTNPIGRKDNLTEAQWGKVSFVYDYAYNVGADVYIAGDVNDASNNYSILNHFSYIVTNYAKKGVGTYAVFGQHDLKYRNKKDTNLQIMENSKIVKILDATPVLGAGFRIYGCSWGNEIPVPRSGDFLDILVIHAPISPVSLFHGHNYIKIEDFIAENPNFDIIICGDVHRTFMEEHNSTLVLNSGPLIRKEANEYNMIHRPGFFYIDLNSIEIKFIEVPHSEAEKVLSRNHIEKKKMKELTAARADTAQFLSELHQRTLEERSMNISERMKAKLEVKKSPISSGAKEVIECLLSERNLEEWLEKL